MASNYMLISNQTAHKWREFSPTSYKLLMEGSTTACIAKVALTTLTLGAPLVVALSWDGAASLKNKITPAPLNPTPAPAPPAKDKPGEKPTTKSSAVKAKDFVFTCVGYAYRATKWGYNRLPQRPLFRYPIITIVALTVISKTIGTGNFFSGLFNYGGPTLKTAYNWVVKPLFNAAGEAVTETAKNAAHGAKVHGPEIIANLYEGTLNKGAALVEGVCAASDFVIDISVKGGKIMADKAADPESWQNMPDKAWAVGGYAIKSMKAILVFGAVTSTATWLVGCAKSCFDNGEKAARKVASFPGKAADYVWDKTAGKAARAVSKRFGNPMKRKWANLTEDRIYIGDEKKTENDLYNAGDTQGAKRVTDAATKRGKLRSQREYLIQVRDNLIKPGVIQYKDGPVGRTPVTSEANMAKYNRLKEVLKDIQIIDDKFIDPSLKEAPKRQTNAEPGVYYINERGKRQPLSAFGRQASRNSDAGNSSDSNHKSSSPRRARRAHPTRRHQRRRASSRGPHFHRSQQPANLPQQFGASNFGYGPPYGYRMPYQGMTPQQHQSALFYQMMQQQAQRRSQGGRATIEEASDDERGASGSAAAAGATFDEQAAYRTGQSAPGSLAEPE